MNMQTICPNIITYPIYLFSIRNLNIDNIITNMINAFNNKNYTFALDKYTLLVSYIASYRALDNKQSKDLNNPINEYNLQDLVQLDLQQLQLEYQHFLLSNPHQLNLLLSLTNIALRELTYIFDDLYTPYLYVTIINKFMEIINSNDVQ